MRSTRTIRLVYSIKTDRERVPARESMKEKLDRQANLAQGGTNEKLPGVFPYVAVYSFYSVNFFTNFQFSICRLSSFPTLIGLSLRRVRRDRLVEPAQIAKPQGLRRPPILWRAGSPDYRLLSASRR